MKKSEFQKRINDAVDYNKSDKVYAPASKNASGFFSGLKKKVLPFVMALGIAVGGLSLASCNDEKKPVEPVDPNPPIVTPIDPEKPDPEKPGPVEPDPDKPGPVDPDPEKPDTPPDKTPEEIEKEKQEKQDKIVQNIYAAVQPQFTLVLGRNLTVNNVYAVDYISNETENNVYMLIDTSNTAGRRLDLIRFPMETSLSENNLLSENTLTASSGARVLLEANGSILETYNTELGNSVYKKFADENFLKNENNNIFSGYTFTGGATDSVIGGYHNLTLYSLTKNSIEKNTCIVKSDGSSTAPIFDNFVNGTLNTTYRLSNADNASYYHEFSNNAIIKMEGLKYEKQAETKTAAKNIMLNGRKIGVYENNQVYINLDEEQEI